MKRAVAVAVGLGVVLTLYLIGAWFEWDFNAGNWPQDLRGLLAFLAVAIAPGVAVAVHEAHRP